MPAFVYTTPVRFADIDHAGIVYFPRFFHFFHLAFEEMWRAKLGARAYVDLLDRDRLGFPAVRAECDYRAPLRFGDLAEIEVRVVRLGRTSVTFGYRVYRAADERVTRVLAAEGQTVSAIVDLARFAATEPPAAVRALLAELMDEGPAEGPKAPPGSQGPRS
ncbi:MAG: acyl-CoA thioesterase [Myxococcales bacterium]|nr:acyl-CoA thioesterase [Myxococcales bacterium]